MEQHDDVMRVTCSICGFTGPNCKEDVDNPRNHYCARCWNKYWEAVGGMSLAPSTQKDGIAAVPCNNDDDNNEEAEETMKVCDGASSYAAATAQQIQSPTEIDLVCAWGGDTRSCDFCNGNLCEESCCNPIQKGQINATMMDAMQWFTHFANLPGLVGTVPILTLLKSLLDVTLFQLLKGQANVINIMIIRWGVLIFSGGWCKLCCSLLCMACTSGHRD
jgi:hypothetical protein